MPMLFVLTYLLLSVGQLIAVAVSRGGRILPLSSPPAFTRQGLQMTWAFAEANPFSTSTQNWRSQVEWVAKAVENLPISGNEGEVYQADATTTIHATDRPLIVTDPPYYDNIHYADSSDFFYVWLRPLIRDIYPELFAGITTPKDEEIVANRYRFEKHNERFEKLLGKAFLQIRQHCSEEFPSLYHVRLQTA